MSLLSKVIKRDKTSKGINYFIIEDECGYFRFRYLHHISDLEVGDTVTEGDIVGRYDWNDPVSRGQHLHIEIKAGPGDDWKHDRPGQIDPEVYFLYLNPITPSPPEIQFRQHYGM